MRILARTLSVICTFLLLLPFLASPEQSTAKLSALQAAEIDFFPVGVIVGYGLSWRHERRGAIVSMASLAISYAIGPIFRDQALHSPLAAMFSLPAVVAFLMVRPPTSRASAASAAT